MSQRALRKLAVLLGFAALLLVCCWAVWAQAARTDYIGPSRTLGMTPPAGAYDLSQLSAWHRADGTPAAWKVEDDAMTPTEGDIISNVTYQDAYVHVEFREPDMPEASGQGKGNSGVFLQGRYEVQVLDSYGLTHPGVGDCGAVYDIASPLFAAYRPPLEWQTYDIIFRAPRFDEKGAKTDDGWITVLLNGLPIQNNVRVPRPNIGCAEEDIPKPGPLVLQDHWCPVFYRNIWVLPLPEKGIDDYAGN
jgi:hypothetical protein